MNVVMTGGGSLVELQGTAEKRTFTREELDEVLNLAQGGIEQVIALQRKALLAEEGIAILGEGP